MKKVLEDLYFGEIQPNISGCEKNDDLQEYMRIIDENTQILLKLLKGKERQLFIELIDAQSQFDGTNEVEVFIKGFKLGARMIAESIIDY